MQPTNFLGIVSRSIQEAGANKTAKPYDCIAIDVITDISITEVLFSFIITLTSLRPCYVLLSYNS